MPSELNLSSLKPASKRAARKRVGRGMGSGKGRYAGRGIKGQKSRSGSHKMPAGFEGGQTRLYMRVPKLPGNTSKDAMPIGPFRTRTQGVNVRDLERVFDAGSEVTPEALKAKRLIRTTRIDVKILGQGELTKTLTVSAHRVSQSAREKIEAAGGSIVLLREPKERKRKKHRKAAPAPEAEVETPEAEETEEVAEPAAQPPVRDSGPVEGAPGEPGGSPADDEAPPTDSE